MEGTGFDIIGDVHGCAGALKALLGTLGYRRRNGTWGHSERRAVFVGDFVDRGKQNLDACRIVMEMTSAGQAAAVLGNHDFNHIALATEDPDRAGQYLRPHSAKNLAQAAETLLEFEADPAGARQVLEWMRGLPLWLDLGPIRVVHAAWSKGAQAALAPLLTAGRALTAEGVMRAARRGDAVFAAREMLLNGPESELPGVLGFADKDGHWRREGRLCWWLAGERGLSWRQVFLSPLPAEAFPVGPVPAGLLGLPDPDPRPVFFGHYWMRWPLTPLSPRHACVDASVGMGGRLAAYRFSGEATLKAERFVVT